MKQIYVLLMLVAAVFCGLCCACVRDAGTDMSEGNQSTYVTYRIGTRILPMRGEKVVPSTRALQPMTPEQENMIRTIAVLQFDAEDNLVSLDSENAEVFYYFKDLRTEESPNGTLTPQLDGISLLSGQRTTVCLVANMTEEQVAALTLNDNGSRVQLPDFRDKTVNIGNILSGENVGENSMNIGHVEQIYMFGYYEGELPGLEENKTLSIDLGRIITRIEINFTIDGKEKLEKKFYIGLSNMEQEAYIFPGTSSPKDVWLDMPPTERSGEINSSVYQFYFYAAPHSATTREEATKLRIWYTDQEPSEDGSLPDTDCYEILLCNNPDVPDTESIEGDYYLNRNSIYHVNIRLTQKQENISVPRSLSVAPGEHTCTLPLP